jgi:ABC-2 type transport system permease protein
VMKIIASFNPISYAVDAVRMALIHQSHFGIVTDFIVLLGTLMAFLAFGSYRFRKIQA